MNNEPARINANAPGFWFLPVVTWQSILYSLFRFHDMRHTAITWMLESGMPAAKVMKISGHTQWSTFMRYVNMSADQMREAAEMMDARRARVETSRRPALVHDSLTQT